MKNNKNIEDRAVITGDIHELVKKEIQCQQKPFMIAYFMGEERLNKKLESFGHTLERVAPGRTIVVLDNIITKAAIVLLYLILIFGCTGS